MPPPPSTAARFRPDASAATFNPALRQLTTAKNDRVCRLADDCPVIRWDGMQPTPRALVRCSFCGISQSNARQLVAGPRAVWICYECILSARRVATQSRPTTEDLQQFALAAPDDRGARCDFCQGTLARVERIVTGGSPTRAICNRCLKLCDEILEETFRSGRRRQSSDP